MAAISSFRNSQPRSQYNFTSSTHSSSYILFFVFTFFCLCIPSTFAGPNVMVDDTDPMIVYTGSWERTPNFEEFSAGGGHVTTSDDPTASVTFTFRGTAVYLTYPLWPYQVSSGWISLDGQAPVRVSLLDPNHSGSDGGRATTPSGIRYMAEGLDPELEHTIHVTAATTGEFVVFDMIMYTLAEPGDSITIRPTSTGTAVTTFVPGQSNTDTRPPLSSNPSPTISSPSSSTSAVRSNVTTSSSPQSGAQSQTQTITIAVCVVAAVLVLLAIPLTFFFCKRRRQQKERDQWTQEALEDYNAAYPKPAEAGYSETPIYTAHTVVPQTPATYASFGSYGNVGYLVPSPTAPDPTYRRKGSKDGLAENDGYMEQIRRNHSQMVAAKSSMGSVTIPVMPPTAAVNTGRDAHMAQPQPWGREHELAVPKSRRRPHARPRRHQSGDSGLSYVTEDPDISPVPQVLQPAPSATDLHSHAVETRDRDRELELEAERQEREQRQRLKLRIRNARSTMMTVNTVSLPPAYEDPSYDAPPPMPPQPESLRPWGHPSSSSSPDGPPRRSPHRSRHYELRRMTKISTLHNPWDDAYGGLSRSVDDDFDGRTLVEASPIRETPSASSGFYAKTRLHTLAPASESH